MTQQFFRSITVLPSGETCVVRLSFELEEEYDLPDVQPIAVHKVAVFKGLVLGFYTGDKVQAERVGQAMSNHFSTQGSVQELISAFRGQGDEQFFMNYNGKNIDPEESFGLSNVTCLCVDLDRELIFIAGDTVKGSLPRLVEINGLTGQVDHHVLGERARSIVSCAAQHGAVVVVLDDGTTKIRMPGQDDLLEFSLLESKYKFRVSKVFPGLHGFYLYQSNNEVVCVNPTDDSLGFVGGLLCLEVMNMLENVLSLDGHDFYIISGFGTYGVYFAQ